MTSSGLLMGRISVLIIHPPPHPGCPVSLEEKDLAEVIRTQYKNSH